MGWMPMNTKVPMDLLAPYVQEYLKNQDEEGIAQLAERAGLCYDVVRRLTLEDRSHCRSKNMPFDDADKIIVALGRPELWLTEPLATVYQGIDLSWIDQKDPIVHDNVRVMAA